MPRCPADGSVFTTVTTFVPRVTKSPMLTFRSTTTPANGARTTVSASALRARGHAVDLNVGQSKFRCDLAVRSGSE